MFLLITKKIYFCDCSINSIEINYLMQINILDKNSSKIHFWKHNYLIHVGIIWSLEEIALQRKIQLFESLDRLVADMYASASSTCASIECI